MWPPWHKVYECAFTVRSTTITHSTFEREKVLFALRVACRFYVFSFTPLAARALCRISDVFRTVAVGTVACRIVLCWVGKRAHLFSPDRIFFFQIYAAEDNDIKLLNIINSLISDQRRTARCTYDCIDFWATWGLCGKKKYYPPRIIYIWRVTPVAPCKYNTIGNNNV